MSEAANLKDGHALRVTRLVELFTVWVFETGTPHVDNFGNNRNGNFFWQYRADIKADRHVDAFETLSRDALAFQLFCDRPDFSLAADHSDVACIGLNGPTEHVLVLLMPTRDDDDVRVVIRYDLLKSLLKTFRVDSFGFWKAFGIRVDRPVINDRCAEAGNSGDLRDLGGDMSGSED